MSKARALGHPHGLHELSRTPVHVARSIAFGALCAADQGIGGGAPASASWPSRSGISSSSQEPAPKPCGRMADLEASRASVSAWTKSTRRSPFALLLPVA
jgi:hypothetical protein